MEKVDLTKEEMADKEEIEAAEVANAVRLSFGDRMASWFRLVLITGKSFTKSFTGKSFTGKSFTGKFAIFFFTVTGKKVTGYR
jgi:hypothetical protein